MLKRGVGPPRPPNGSSAVPPGRVLAAAPPAEPVPRPDLGSSSSVRPALPAAAAPRGRRSPKWVALGVLAICLGALGSYLLYANLADQHQVVMVRQAVPRGGVIGTADLSTVTVGSVGGLATVPADQLSAVVGRRTSVDLSAGTLLPPDAATSDPVPAPGHALVGLRLPDGHAPHGNLDPGSAVRIVSLPSTEAGKAGGVADVAVSGRVVGVTALADGQSVLVDVDVAASQAALVARLAARDQVVMVRDPDG